MTFRSFWHNSDPLNWGVRPTLKAHFLSGGDKPCHLLMKRMLKWPCNILNFGKSISQAFSVYFNQATGETFFSTYIFHSYATKFSLRINPKDISIIRNFEMFIEERNKDCTFCLSPFKPPLNFRCEKYYKAVLRIQMRAKILLENLSMDFKMLITTIFLDIVVFLFPWISQFIAHDRFVHFSALSLPVNYHSNSLHLALRE